MKLEVGRNGQGPRVVLFVCCVVAAGFASGCTSGNGEDDPLTCRGSDCPSQWCIDVMVEVFGAESAAEMIADGRYEECRDLPVPTLRASLYNEEFCEVAGRPHCMIEVEWDEIDACDGGGLCYNSEGEQICCGEASYEIYRELTPGEGCEHSCADGTFSEPIDTHYASGRYGDESAQELGGDEPVTVYYRIRAIGPLYPWEQSDLSEVVSVVLPPMCVPECGDLECGVDPVCGTSCGRCEGGEVCTDEGLCEEAPDITCPGMPTVEDERGNVYDTVQVGDQCWMASDLRLGRVVSSTRASDNDVLEKRCSEGSQGDCEGLYTWNELMNYGAGGSACPTGWHLPSRREWEDLYDHDDRRRFDAQFRGFYALYDDPAGATGYYWTSTEREAGVEGTAYVLSVHYSSQDDPEISTYNKGYWMAARCVRSI